MVDGRLTRGDRGDGARASLLRCSSRRPAARAAHGAARPVSEAAAGLMARPARVALTVLGTVIGVAALVATLGLSKTAGNQIVGRFDEVAATDVVVTPVPGAQRSGGAAAERDPVGRRGAHAPAERRGRGGHAREVNVRGALVRSVPINDPLGQTDVQLPVRAASPGLWRAVRARFVAGRVPRRGPLARAATASPCWAQRRPPARHHEPRPAAGDLHRRPPLPGDRPGGGRRAPGLAARLADDPERHRAARVRRWPPRARCRSRPRSARSS